jgi:hypothetical protein
VLRRKKASELNIEAFFDQTLKISLVYVSAEKTVKNIQKTINNSGSWDPQKKEIKAGRVCGTPVILYFDANL